jgi:hypothetical protein
MLEKIDLDFIPDFLEERADDSRYMRGLDHLGSTTRNGPGTHWRRLRSWRALETRAHQLALMRCKTTDAMSAILDTIKETMNAGGFRAAWWKGAEGRVDDITVYDGKWFSTTRLSKLVDEYTRRAQWRALIVPDHVGAECNRLKVLERTQLTRQFAYSNAFRKAIELRLAAFIDRELLDREHVYHHHGVFFVENQGRTHTLTLGHNGKLEWHSGSRAFTT